MRIPELAFIPSQRELLENYYIPTISHFTGGPEYLYSLAEYILESGNIEALSSSGRESLSGIDFITVSGNRNIFTSPKNLVDSGSIAAKFFYPDENVFPETQLLERFRASLERLHMVSTLTPEIILGRLEAFSKRREPDLSARLQLLLTQAHHPPLLSAEHLSLRWIPATDTLGERVYCNSYECRDRLQSSLVKYAMPMTDLEIGSLWQVQLGWKRPVTELNVAGDYSQDQQPRATPPEPRYVIKQLEEAVNRQDNSVIASLLKSGWLKSKGVDEYLDSLAWIPGKSGGYYLRSDVFFEEHGTIFQPYLDVIQPHFKKYFHPSTQTYGGVSFALEKSPGFGKVLADILVALYS